MRGKLKYLKFWRIWRPTVRRFGRKGALVLLGIPTALIIGSAAYASLLLATGGGSINLQSGLVGWWKFDDNTLDSTIYAHNATPHGSPTPAADEEGNANGAYYLNDAHPDYMSVASSPSSLNGNTTFTYSVWLMRSGASIYHWPEIMGSANTHLHYGIRSGNYGDDIYFEFGTSPYGGSTYSSATFCSSTNLPVGQWHQFTVTYDGTTLKLYKDGSFCTQTTAFAPDPTAGDFGFSSSGSAWNGTLDDARVYNRALSSTEVTALYGQYHPQLNVDSGESGLIGQWKLNNSAKDSTPHAYDGTITGSPTPTTDREGAANSAYSFSGTGQYIAIPNFDNTVMRQGQEGKSWTLSVWTTGGSQNGVLFGKVGWNGGILQNGTTYTFSLVSSSDTFYTISKTGNNTSVWHLLTAVYDAGTMYFYVDGQLAGSKAGPTTMYPYGTTLGIGSGGTNSWLTNATLSDARVYSRALSQSDISHLYDSYNSQINLYSSAASGGGGADISSGLVGEWNFTGNARDATPYSDNGTVTGATLTADRFGSLNSAYSFNGTNQYINLGNPSVLNITGDITINAWIYLNTTAQAAIVTWANSYSNFPYHFVTTGSNPPKLRLNRTSYSKDSGSSFSTGAWTMVTVTVSGNQLNYYFNAVPDSSNPQTTSGTVPSGDGYLTISRNGTQNFNGSIDDIRIYNRALSAADIQALYNLN